MHQYLSRQVSRISFVIMVQRLDGPEVLPFSLSPKQQVKKMDDPPEEINSAPKNEQLVSSNELSKEAKQLEIYCKSHGGAEKLVLRKYPSAPLPAGENHVLVRVEVRIAHVCCHAALFLDRFY